MRVGMGSKRERVTLHRRTIRTGWRWSRGTPGIRGLNAMAPPWASRNGASIEKQARRDSPRLPLFRSILFRQHHGGARLAVVAAVEENFQLVPA